MNEILLKALVCPVCKGELDHTDNSLQCRCCNDSYPIKDGVPVLLPKHLRKE